MTRRWVNRSGLNPVVVAAVIDDDYDRGNSDLTVTQLLDAPYRVAQLRRPEMENVTADPVDRIYALFGKLIHSLLENGHPKMSGDKADIVNRLCPGYGEVNTEDRLYDEHMGIRWSGQYDLHYQRGTKWILEDHKVVSVDEFRINRQESKWEQQLNLLALLLRLNGKPIDDVAINCYYRDWSKAKAMFDRSGEYPKRQHVRVPFKLWSIQRQIAFLEDRITAHRLAANTPCTAEERWAKPAKWAVMVPGKSRASRLLDTKDEAESWLHEKMMDKKAARGFAGASIEERPGVSLRCLAYCEAAEICPHWAELRSKQASQSLDNEVIDNGIE